MPPVLARGRVQSMAPAHEGVASGGRRRNLSWVTLFCFGGSRRERGQEASSAEGTTPWERSRRRRKKRTVPVVDGDDLVGTAADSEVMRRGTGTDEEESRKRKGLRLPGCCFLPPARAPGREHSALDSSSGRNKQQRHPERTEQLPPPPPRRSQSDNNSPSEASRIQATDGSSSNGSRSRGAEQPRSAPPAETTRTPTTKPSKTGAGVGAFGPVVGLSVVVAVSMAGLLGGRLWAVACVCAWLAALSRVRLREATAAAAAAGEVVVVDVDSTDHKEPVVLRGLIERDRRKAVAAA